MKTLILLLAFSVPIGPDNEIRDFRPFVSEHEVERFNYRVERVEDWVGYVGMKTAGLEGYLRIYVRGSGEIGDYTTEIYWCKPGTYRHSTGYLVYGVSRY